MSQTAHSSLDHADLQNILKICTSAVQSVSSTLKENYGKADYTTKAHANDWVTKWDKWAETEIVARLEAFDSTIGILAEEGARKAGSDFYWTVDPIDGTSHFVNGVPKCTTMIALVESGVPVASVIYDFVHGNLYSAATGMGAFKNNHEKLSINAHALQDATVELNMHLPEPAQTTLIKALETQGVNMVQNYASGYSGIQMATGQINGMVYIGAAPPSEWDIAPVAILVREAGAVVSNLETDDYHLGRNNFISGSTVFVRDLQKIYDTL